MQEKLSGNSLLSNSFSEVILIQSSSAASWSFVSYANAVAHGALFSYANGVANVSHVFVLSISDITFDNLSLESAASYASLDYVDDNGARGGESSSLANIII